jgi:4-hydroxy-tetrahydrodipicolinate synthase
MLHSIRGVLAPVVTPFRADYAPEPGRFIRHCQWLLAHGCNGLAVFGTNSEANSLDTGERIDLLEQLVAGGVPPAALMPGTGCCSLGETVRLTAHAVQLGAAGVLMLPPFYYKGVPDEGLSRHFSEVIQRVGSDRLRIYLYHIPPVAGVGIPHGVIARLLDAYPGIVAGIKDSSGDWSSTASLIAEFGPRGFDVFAGSEVFLLRTLRAGGAGCITAGANVNPHGIGAVYRAWQSEDVDALQSQADAVRRVVQSSSSMIPALKACIAHYGSDEGWRVVRPPLVELEPAERTRLIGDLDALGFAMPGVVTATP